MPTKRSGETDDKSRKSRRSIFKTTRRSEDIPYIGGGALQVASPATALFSGMMPPPPPPQPPPRAKKPAQAPQPTTPPPRARHIDIFEAAKSLKKGTPTTTSSPLTGESPHRAAAIFFSAGQHVFDKHARHILAQRNLTVPRYNAPSIAATADSIWEEMVRDDMDERKFWDDIVVEARFALGRGTVSAEQLMAANGLPEKEEMAFLRAQGVVEAYLERVEKGEGEAEEVEVEAAVQQTLTPVRARIVDVPGSK
ncbi:hypothetical protein Q7P37_002512 [Cladosporium fusiforme]